MGTASAAGASSMRAVRLQARGGPEQLVVEQIPMPAAEEGEALVRVHAAAITRNELDWPEDRFPAIPSYELSGVVEAIGPGVTSVDVGQEVVGLTPFDRDGVAADFAVVPVGVLASKPSAVDDVHSAALPMPALTAWQALQEHGRLQEGQRVLILGAGGGVGHIAGQIASRHFGAHVIGTASAASADFARSAGADERIGSRCGRRIDRAGRSHLRHCRRRALGAGRGGSSARWDDRDGGGRATRGPRGHLLRRRAERCSARGARSDGRSWRLATVRRFRVPARGCAGGVRTEPAPQQARQSRAGCRAVSNVTVGSTNSSPGRRAHRPSVG